jgi:antirestriction protein ArdC
METATATREDIYTRITNQIIEKLEQGVRPWMRPWAANHAAGSITRPLRHSGERCQGINIVAIWMSAELNGYTTPFWLTFQQTKELGGNVRKGEHGSIVVYASSFKKTEKDEAGEDVEIDQAFLKRYTVFNAEQCDGLPQHCAATLPTVNETNERIQAAERFFAATGAEIRYGGNRAFYTVDEDYIHLPHFETFRDAKSHAATLAHELCHWTRQSIAVKPRPGQKTAGEIPVARPKNW